MQLFGFRPEVLAALTQTREVKAQVREVAGEVRDLARDIAPVDTGALRRSIKVVNVYDRDTGRVEYHVGWDRSIAFYGPMVELGTEDTAAQPHLRPAADVYRR